MTAYRTPGPADAATVRAVYIESFDKVFRHLYAPADYEAFVAEHDDAAFAEQLADPAYAFRLAEAKGRAVGFAKLGPPSLPYDPAGRVCIELRQLYLLDEAMGGGVAPALIDWCFAEARTRGATEMWLSVYSDNPRARRFYARYGFVEVRHFDYLVGNHVDDEILCRLDL